jgi:indolepyruvate decarboxylase
MVCDDHRGRSVAFTVADYILKRLSEQQIDRLFGVPAAYCAPLFDAAPNHGIKSVVEASDHPHDLPAELP